MNDLWAALALVLVLEGILPFLAPAQWKQAISQIARADDATLRMIGLGCMAVGLVSLWWVRA
ncbi:MAG: DUF2065 domain-containing protein [Rhodanobacteraceae bacterium]|nr:DUF2065 domain-containing protein [Rhodanobacteraceae bacterium]